MAIINFTAGDVLRNKILDKGWYSWRIASVLGPVTNANQDGVNYTVVFQLIDKDESMNGKEIRRVFSSKAIGMMIPLFAAVRGIPKANIKVEDFAKSADTEELVGKVIDGYADQDTYQGQLKNILEEYLPYKSAAGQATAF